MGAAIEVTDLATDTSMPGWGRLSLVWADGLVGLRGRNSSHSSSVRFRPAIWQAKSMARSRSVSHR